ncbi:MAG: MoaD/ThiS family protein [Rhodothermales bacterium]
MYTFQVLFFSVLRQHVKADCITVELESPATGATLLDYLEREYPVIGPYRSVVRLAVNEEYVPESIVLSDGDEVALITPVSGG